MKRTHALAAAALALPAVVATGTAATAAPTGMTADRGMGTSVYRAHLTELNDSGAHGTAMLRLRGDELTIRVKARGLLPNAVHAQHIHGKGNSECPPAGAGGDDGVLTTLEGLPFYGAIVASLTTSGDTSPAAALDIEIMPVADAKGRIDYSRTFTLPQGVAEDITDFQVVQHGVDLNGSGGYDFGPGASELNPAFPLEATAPANCGTIGPVSHHH